MQQPMSSVYLLFIHRIQLLCDNHGDGDANHGNTYCNGNGNNNNNRNENGDGDGDGDSGCDYKLNSNAIATDVGISLVVVEPATAVISMIVVVDFQEQAGLRVTNKNPVENNRCIYFSCIVIYNFLVEHS